MLLGRVLVPLAAQQLERLDQHRARATRLDDVVDEAARRRLVGVGELVLVVVDQPLLLGRGVVVDAARDDERAEYRDTCTPFLWGVAVAILPLRLLSTIVDNVLLATQDFRVLGKLYFVGFSIYFAALAAAYRHFRSLAAVFFADFLFYAARGSLSLVYIRNVTFRRDPWWVARAPVDDPLDVYVAEMVGLLDTFGNRTFKRVFLRLLNSSALGKRWFVILVGIWRSMATDLQQASEVLATRRRSSLFRPKVRPS